MNVELIRSRIKELEVLDKEYVAKSLAIARDRLRIASMINENLLWLQKIESKHNIAELNDNIRQALERLEHTTENSKGENHGR